MRLVGQGLTALGAACILWLSLGIVAVLGQGTAARVGLLPPVWTLIAILVVVAAAALVVRAHGGSSLIWLPSVLLVLPWLPIVVPAAFLLWVGPIASLIWMTIAAGVFPFVFARAPSSVSAVTRVGARTLQHPMHAPLIAGVLAAALYLVTGGQLSGRLPTGDEPHYLIIADSLLHDGDLQIENNHRAHQYLAYVHGELKPDYLRRGANGQIYSIHAPGLPALLLPAYAIVGYAGAVVFLALIFAAGSALAWRLCWTLTGRPAAAWFGWAVAALPAPALFHAATIYPDCIGGVLVLTGVAALVHASRMSVRTAALHGAALALLPWLHTRFVLLAAALGLCAIARLCAGPRTERVRVIGAFFVIPAVSAAAWFAFFYAIYGDADPRAPYGAYTQSALAHIPAGLTGLFFDQQFGLAPNAPVYLVGLWGLGWLIFRPWQRAAADPASDPRVRRLAIEMTIVIVPYVLAAAMYRMWWGGLSAPGRFLVAVLPMLSLPAAIVWARARTQTTRSSAMVALGVSVWLSAVMLLVERGRLVYNQRDGFALWTDFAQPGVDLGAGLPSLFQTPWPSALARAAIWAVVIGLTWTALRMLERRMRPPLAAFSSAVVPSAYALAIMMALTIVWRVADVSGVRPDEGQVDLLREAQARRWSTAIAYGDSPRDAMVETNGLWLRPHLITRAAVPDSLRIDTATRRIPRERPLFFMPRMPAGHYRLIVDTSGAPDGRLDVFVGRSFAPLRSFDVSAGPAELFLPIAVESLSIRPDERARRAVARVALVPRSQASSDRAAAGADRHVDRLPGQVALQTMRYAAATVYAMSGAIYLEPGGFWVQPRVDAGLLIEPDQPATTMTVLVRNGPVGNRVRLEVESWQREVTLEAGSERLVELPASRRGPTPLRIHAAEGFRPSALDPKNGDHRPLGAWVELR